MSKRKSYKTLMLIYIIDVLVCLLPLAIPVGINWQYYTATTQRVVTLSAGTVMLIIVAVLIAVGKLPKGMGSVFWLTVLDLILFFIDPIITQLKWLVLATASGQAVSAFLIRPFSRKYKTEMLQERQAEVVVKALREE